MERALRKASTEKLWEKASTKKALDGGIHKKGEASTEKLWEKAFTEILEKRHLRRKHEERHQRIYFWEKG